MKRIIFTILSVFICLLASAATKIGGLYYNLNSSSKTAAVTYYSSSSSTNKDYVSGALTIPAVVSYNSIEYSVTSIGNSAFYNCSGLTSIEIPNSVTSIGNYAFERCTSIKEVTIEDGENTLKLGYNSSSSGQFDSCPLEKIYIGRTLSYSSGSSYGYSPFANQTKLTTVTIGDKVTSLPENLLYGCNGLTSVEIPNSVTLIGEGAFSGCSGLTSIEIPNSVTSIGNYAFYNCSGLTSIEIPNSVTSIGNYAFERCSSIKEVTIEDGENTLKLGYNSSSLGQFGSCPLEKIYIGRTLSYSSGYSYGYSPFAKQTALKEVTIGDKVISLPDYLFYNCSGLTSIEIPISVTSIGNYAFQGCEALKKLIYSPGSQFASIETEAFDDGFYDSSYIYVTDPEMTFEILNNSYWSKFSKILYLKEGEEYVPITYDFPITILGEGIIYKNENGALSIIGNEVNLKCSNALMAIFNGQDITTAINSAEGYSFKPDIFWKLNHITGAIEGGELTRVVSLPAAGELFNQIGVQDIQKIEALKVVGDINGTDVMTINRMTNLKNLDLSEANIVEGGQTYRDNLKTSTNIVGSYFFYDCNNLQNLILPTSATSIGGNAFNGRSMLSNVIVGENVKTIGESAFKDCGNLSRIEIPNSVTSIGNYAFNGCSSIKEVIIEDGENTLKLGYNSSSGQFGDCPLERIYIGRTLSYSSSYGYSPFAKQTALKEVKIGNKVTSLPAYLLYGCSGLPSVEIPNSVTTIGNYAFEGCSSIKEVIIEEGETTLKLGYNSSSSGQFGSCPLEKIYIGRNLSYSSGSSYGYSPFAKQSKLISVTIGENVTSLTEYLLYCCSGLTSIEIPISVTSIGNSAFYNCSGLTSIEIPNSVTLIGSAAFSGCSGLTSVEIPNSVTSIGNYAFEGCSSIKEVTIEDGENTLKLGYNSLSGQFGSCPLEKIYIGRTLSYSSGYSYGYSPFAKQTALKEVTIGDKVISLPDYLFYNCSGLTSIEIPNSVTSIGNYAFFSCTSLSNVNFIEGENPISLGYNSYNSSGTGKGLFADCPLETLHIGRNYAVKNYNSTYPSSSYPQRYGYSPFANQTKLITVTIGDKVTSLPAYFLYNCSELTSVEIPNSVTSIGSWAFYDCTKLNRVDILDLKQWCDISFGSIGANPLYYAHHLYLNDELLTSIEIPEGINKIKDCTFAGGEDFTSVEIHNSVTSIGERAFYDCTGLTRVTIGNSVTKIENYAFRGCSGLNSVEIPNSVISIGNFAFAYCSGLTSVTIPNSVTSIGNSAFSGCTSISNVNFIDGENLISLGYNSYNSSGTGKGLFADCPLETLYLGRNYTVIDYTSSYPSSSYLQRYGYSPFANQTKLITVTIGDKVTSLPAYILYNCSELTSVEIGNSVTSIENYAFNGCSKINRVDIYDLKQWCDISFGNLYANPLYYAHHLYLNDELLTSIEIPEGINKIKDYTFAGGEDFTSVTIPDSVKSIGARAFYNCSGLTSVEIPNSVTSIGTYAFYGCDGLKSVVLGDKLPAIGDNAFKGCTGLVKLYSLNPTPPKITASVFDGVVKEECLLMVTKGNLVYYWLDPVWKDFLNMSDDLIYLNPLPNAKYGDAPVDLAVYAPEGVTLKYETSNDEVALLDGTMLTIIGAGEVTIGASYDQSGSPMEIMGQMRQFIVDKADLTVSVENVEVYVGQEVPALTLSVSGFCYADTLEDIDEMPVATSNVTSESAPGEYPVLFSGGKDNNYNFVFADSKVIVKERRKITIPSPENVTYGDEPVDLSHYTPEGEYVTYSLSDGDIAEINDNILTIKGAGTVTILASLPEDVNDAVLVNPELTLVIDKADLTIKVQDVVVTVGDDIPEFVLTAEGLCYDDTLEDLEELPTAYCDAIKGSSPGVYTIYLEGGDSENYNLILENGILTILDADTTTISDFYEGDNDRIIVVNYNGVVLYDGPEEDMGTLEPGMYIIVKGKESRKVVVK